MKELEKIMQVIPVIHGVAGSDLCLDRCFFFVLSSFISILLVFRCSFTYMLKYMPIDKFIQISDPYIKNIATFMLRT